MSYRLFKSEPGILVESQGKFFILGDADWDVLFNRDDLFQHLAVRIEGLTALAGFDLEKAPLRAPIGSQEVWAAGVTYYRSRDARMEEAQKAGGGSFYDRVYTAERPELFFKAAPHRVAGHLQPVRIRKDSKWNVPEPELALAVNAGGKIIGYTIGNDMSSRDIEGENPLYLPQAKIYDQCCSLGPGLWVSPEPLPRSTAIALEIGHGGKALFRGATSLAELKRSFESLVEFLFRECSFPNGCFLLTGTGIIPPDAFTLQPGDEVRITIEPIGTLINPVIQKK